MTAADLNAVEMAELFAEKRATDEELEAARSLIEGRVPNAAYYAAAPKRCFRQSISECLKLAVPHEEQPGFYPTYPTQVALVREVFGNPFRPCRLGTGLAIPITLVQAAYEERELPSGHLDNACLAVLSDALEEAGCSEDAILSHLRSPAPHVRGCWALDLILGRS